MSWVNCIFNSLFNMKVEFYVGWVIEGVIGLVYKVDFMYLLLYVNVFLWLEVVIK